MPEKFRAAGSCGGQIGYNIMELIYTIKNQEVCVDQVQEPEETVVIPEELEHLPVTELGAYALAGSGVEEVYLPLRMKKIGAYAFYNCEKLRRISCSSRVNDLGTGVFAGARDVEALDFTLLEGEKSCLKDLLSELRQTLRLRIVERKAPECAEEYIGEDVNRAENGGAGLECREARLIFPEYFEESVENTPARIVSVETHGCGHRYRYCFVNRQFQYKDYDALFPHVKVQEPERLVVELALGRLMYPCGLTEKHRDMYWEYVAEHWLEAGRLLIEADRLGRQRVTNLDAGRLPWLVEALSERTPEPDSLSEKLGKYIDLAQQASDTEMVSWLMNFRHRRNADAKKFPAGAAGTVGGMESAGAAGTAGGMESVGAAGTAGGMESAGAEKEGEGLAEMKEAAGGLRIQTKETLQEDEKLQMKELSKVGKRKRRFEL